MTDRNIAPCKHVDKQVARRTLPIRSDGKGSSGKNQCRELHRFFAESDPTLKGNQFQVLSGRSASKMK